MQNIKNIIDSFPSKTIHGKLITFETRIFEIPEQGIELKVFANNSWTVNGKTGYEPFYADMQAFWRTIYNPEGKEEDDSLSLSISL